MFSKVRSHLATFGLDYGIGLVSGIGLTLKTLVWTKELLQPPAIPIEEGYHRSETEAFIKAKAPLFDA